MRCGSCGFENLPGMQTCEACHDLLRRPGPGDADRELAESISSDPLSVLNPVSAVAVEPDTSLAEVVRLLAERNIGCVLVTAGDDLVGIFSERDALRRIGNRFHEISDQPIRDFMTPSPETLTPEDSIAFALNRMDNNDFRHIPVESDGKVVGIISVRDCLAYVTRHFPELHSQTN